MKFEIKHRWNSEVLFSIETDSWRLAVEAAVKAGPNLSKADLSKANLRYIKHDVWGVIAHAIPEIPALRASLVEGRVNGSAYEGECACLCGTIANARKCSYKELDGITPDSDSMAERFF